MNIVNRSISDTDLIYQENLKYVEIDWEKLNKLLLFLKHIILNFKKTRHSITIKLLR